MGELLQGLSRHPFLRSRVALKGGTAVNLVVLDVPRLSVDIDLDYVGAADLQTLNEERPRSIGRSRPRVGASAST